MAKKVLWLVAPALLIAGVLLALKMSIISTVSKQDAGKTPTLCLGTLKECAGKNVEVTGEVVDEEWQRAMFFISDYPNETKFKTESGNYLIVRSAEPIAALAGDRLRIVGVVQVFKNEAVKGGKLSESFDEYQILVNTWQKY